MTISHLNVKVLHSLVAIGAVRGYRPFVSWAQHMNGGAHPSPFATLFFRNSKKKKKKIQVSSWVDRGSFLLAGWSNPDLNP